MSDQSGSMVTIGGRQFAASCLSLGVFRRHINDLKLVMAMRSKVVADTATDPRAAMERELPSSEQFSAVIAIVGSSLVPTEISGPFVGVNFGDEVTDAEHGARLAAFGSFINKIEFTRGIKELFAALVIVMKTSGYVEGTADVGEAQGAAPST